LDYLLERQPFVKEAFSIFLFPILLSPTLWLSAGTILRTRFNIYPQRKPALTALLPETPLIIKHPAFLV